MDEEPTRRRYSNGDISAALSTRLLQSLSDTNIDRWGDTERANLRGNNQWVTEHRRTVGSRRRMVLLVAGIGIPLFGAAAAWYGASNARPSPCPPGYICTVTPIPTATP